MESMVRASFGGKARCRIMHLSLLVQSSTTTYTHTEWILIESKWRTISPCPDAEPMPLVSGFVGQACFCFPRICIVLQEVAGNMHRLYSSLLWPNCLLPFTHSAASSPFIGFADFFCKWHMVPWGLGGLDKHSQRWVGIHMPTRVQKRFSDRWLVKFAHQKWSPRTNMLSRKTICQTSCLEVYIA